MKISLNWLRDFVTFPTEYNCSKKSLQEIKDLAKKIAEDITLSICEVDDWQVWGGSLFSLKVAKILEVANHPNSEKLHCVTITTDNKDKITIVCGASNVKEGAIVAYAPTNSILEDGTQIKPCEIRGVRSEGMLCSPKEIDLSDEHEGILLLPDSTKLNQNLLDLFPDHLDIVFDIDNKSITHRADLWGHYGFAREMASLYERELKDYLAEPIELKETKVKKPIIVDESCRNTVVRYSSLVIDNIQVKPSSYKVQHRLYRVGSRTINNLVDMTNYIMLDLGQPMHAFDAHSISSQGLQIRMANGEKLDTLVGKEVQLQQQDMVICNDDRVLVAAGVVGGEESGVKEETTQILVEAATWHAATVRKTSLSMGIRTDSSQRFEKTLDPSMTLLALQKAVSFLQEYSDSISFFDFSDHYPVPLAKKVIPVCTDNIRRKLGIQEFPADEIEKIITALGFIVEEKEGNKLSLVIPSWRQIKDITNEEDIIEEVARVYGYNNLDFIPPKLSIVASSMDKSYLLQRKVQDTLVAQGYNEIYHHPLVSKEQIIDETTSWKIINPVSQEQSYLRDNLIKQFLQRIVLLQKTSLNLQIFEIGRLYYKHNDEAIEKEELCLAFTREKVTQGDGFYVFKEQINRLFATLKLTLPQWKREKPSESWQHTNIYASLYNNDEKVGEVYALAPSYKNKLSLRGEVYFCQISIYALQDLEQKIYRAYKEVKFPPVRFEISVAVPVRTDYSTLEKLIYEFEKKTFNIRCLSIYLLNENTKSVSIEILFQDSEKTITAEETKALQDGVVAHLASHGFDLKQ